METLLAEQQPTSVLSLKMEVIVLDWDAVKRTENVKCDVKVNLGILQRQSWGLIQRHPLCLTFCAQKGFYFIVDQLSSILGPKK